MNIGLTRSEQVISRYLFALLAQNRDLHFLFFESTFGQPGRGEHMLSMKLILYFCVLVTAMVLALLQIHWDLTHRVQPVQDFPQSCNVSFQANWNCYGKYVFGVNKIPPVNHSVIPFNTP